MTSNYNFADNIFPLFWVDFKVRLSEKVSEIFVQVSEKTKLESLAGLGYAM